MLTLRWEEVRPKAMLPPVLVACGPTASALGAGPLLRVLCLCSVLAVHPVEHPQEWPEGVRVRPPRRCHRPLCAVWLQRLQAGSSSPGPALRFRLRGKLHADVFCHRGRHLQGTWGCRGG